MNIFNWIFIRVLNVIIVSVIYTKAISFGDRLFLTRPSLITRVARKWDDAPEWHSTRPPPPPAPIRTRNSVDEKAQAGLSDVSRNRYYRGNPVFSYSSSWKSNGLDDTAASVGQPPANSARIINPDQMAETSGGATVTQFHSQDEKGRVMFGFNSPDQMRVETRNADGTVRGTYSYLDSNGRVLRTQYWDMGDGFHMTNDIYPLGDYIQPQQQLVETTNGLHQQSPQQINYRLYKQALSSLFTSTTDTPLKVLKNDDLDIGKNIYDVKHSTPVPDKMEENDKKYTEKPEYPDNNKVYENVHNHSQPEGEKFPEGSRIMDQAGENSQKDLAVGESTRVDKLESVPHNGSILIKNPEFFKISWITENKDSAKNNFESEKRNGLQLDVNTFDKVIETETWPSSE